MDFSGRFDFFFFTLQRRPARKPKKKKTKTTKTKHTAHTLTSSRKNNDEKYPEHWRQAQRHYIKAAKGLSFFFFFFFFSIIYSRLASFPLLLCLFVFFCFENKLVTPPIFFFFFFFFFWFCFMQHRLKLREIGGCPFLSFRQSVRHVRRKKLTLSHNKDVETFS